MKRAGIALLLGLAMLFVGAVGGMFLGWLASALSPYVAATVLCAPLVAYWSWKAAGAVEGSKSE